MATRVLVIDNYDSFVFNLVQYLGELGAEPVVHRNDALTVDEALALGADAVLLSPGPGRPEHAGIIGRRSSPPSAAQGCRSSGSASATRPSATSTAGAIVARARADARQDLVDQPRRPRACFAGLPDPLEATRYHSLVVERDGLPDCLEVTAETADGTIMGLRHRDLPVEGVQFHPESILTIGRPRPAAPASSALALAR